MNKSKIITVVKLVTGTMTAVGTTAIVGAAAKNLCPVTDAGRIMKICVGFGTGILSTLVADRCCAYQDVMIDTLVDLAKAISKCVEATIEEEDPIEAEA